MRRTVHRSAWGWGRRVRLTLMAVVTSALSSRGATFSWDGGPSGTGTNWHEAVNWSGDTVPTPTDTVYIAMSGADVWVAEDANVQQLEMGTTANRGPMTLTLASGTLTVTNGLVYIGKMSNTFARVRQIGGHFFGGGTNTAGAGDHLMLGGYRSATYGGTGIWELTEGSLTMRLGRYVYVGYEGSGAYGGFYQRGGSVDLWGGQFRLAHTAGTRGLYVMEGGTNRCSEIVVGNYGEAIVTQSAGVIVCSNQFTIGSQASSRGRYVLSGGTLQAGAFSMTKGQHTFVQTGGMVTNSGAATFGASDSSIVDVYIAGGEFTSFSGNTLIGSATGSTCTWTQVGGAVRGTDVRIGNYGVATYILSNGTFSASSYLRLGMYPQADGTLIVYGGTVSVGGDVLAHYAAGRRKIQIVGSGCGSFLVGGSFSLGGNDSTLRVDLDGTPQGVTPIVAGGASFNLSTAKLEVAVQEGVYRTVGESFDLIRIPTNRSFVTNALTLTTLTPGYDFTWSILSNVGGYNKLVITCTQAPSPPKAQGTLVVIR